MSFVPIRSVPLKAMCSNMCARPDCPAASCTEPALTWVKNEKTGAPGLSQTTTVRPLSSVLVATRFSNEARSCARAPAAATTNAAATALAIARLLVIWLLPSTDGVCTVSMADTTKRRFMSTNSGFGAFSSEIVRGSSAILQIGHEPGPGRPAEILEAARSAEEVALPVVDDRALRLDRVDFMTEGRVIAVFSTTLAPRLAALRGTALRLLP